MALKRKRSSPTFSSPFSETSTSTDSSNAHSLPFFYTQSKPTEPLYTKPTWSFPTYDSDSSISSPHLNSRTRKRHRDDRPDEKAIYASTISKLYEAQRHLPKEEPIRELTAMDGGVRSESQTTTQKSTLHAFWNIAGPAPAPASPGMQMAVDTTTNLGLRCEDCDGPLRQDDAMDLDEDAVEQETVCSVCRRQVCDKCAVLGNARVCLNCASWSGR